MEKEEWNEGGRRLPLKGGQHSLEESDLPSSLVFQKYLSLERWYWELGACGFLSAESLEHPAVNFLGRVLTPYLPTSEVPPFNYRRFALLI